jgi:hypothetical protein
MVAADGNHTETVRLLLPCVLDITQLERTLESADDNEEIRQAIQERIDEINKNKKRTKPEAAGAGSGSSCNGSGGGASEEAWIT